MRYRILQTTPEGPFIEDNIEHKRYHAKGLTVNAAQCLVNKANCTNAIIEERTHGLYIDWKDGNGWVQEVFFPTRPQPTDSGITKRLTNEEVMKLMSSATFMLEYKKPKSNEGWICPVCNAGVNPTLLVCPCNELSKCKKQS